VRRRAAGSEPSAGRIAHNRTNVSERARRHDRSGPRFDPLPDALEPGFHCVRTHWIRGFMTLRLARCARIVMLMVSA
jgi:hypothetical protein